MATLTNSFEGGSNTTAITAGNSGGASGNAFDGVGVTGVGSSVTFDNTHAAHGTLSCKLTHGSGVASTVYDQWTTSFGTPLTFWMRAYLYFTVNPTANTRIFQSLGPANNIITMHTDGTLVTTATSGTGCTTTAVPLNAWFRLEMRIICSTTVGQHELKIFNSPDSTVADQSITGAASMSTGATGPTNYVFGDWAGATETSAWTYWQDDIGLTDVAYLGPVVTAAPPAQQVQPGGQAYRRKWRRPQGLIQPLAVSLDLTVTAGLATATGASLDAVTENDAQPALPAGTGAAQAPGMGLASALASSTGSAQGPGTGITPGLAASTGTAQGPGIGIRALNATAFGDIQPVQRLMLSPALASGTGAALAPAVEIDVAALLATGTGAALDAVTQALFTQVQSAQPGGAAFRRRWRTPQQVTQPPPPSVPVLNVTAGLATGTGAALSAVTENDAQGGLGSGTGAAGTLGLGLGAPLASGTGAAGVPGIGLASALASSTGQAQGPGTGLAAPLASGAGASQSPGLMLGSGLAATTGTALAPGIMLSPALATAAGLAQSAGMMLSPALATGAGTALNAPVETDVICGLATGTGTALDVPLTATAPAAAVQPGGRSFRARYRQPQQMQRVVPLTILNVTAGLASGTGTALDLAIGLGAPLAASTGAALAPGEGLGAGLPSAVGAAQAAGEGLGAGLSTSTGAALAPGEALSPVLASCTGAAKPCGTGLGGGLASAAGSPQAAVPAMSAVTGLATSSGAATAPGTALAPGAATGTGTARLASPSFGVITITAAGAGAAQLAAAGIVVSTIQLRGLTAGAPHGRWSPGDPHGGGYDALAPAGRWSTADPAGRYSCGKAHGRWTAGRPHG